MCKSSIFQLTFRGAIAQQIVKDIREAGGTLSLKDLAEYKAIVRKPLEAELKGMTMLSNPPPGSGALISLALKIMEGKLNSCSCDRKLQLSMSICNIFNEFIVSKKLFRNSFHFYCKF